MQTPGNCIVAVAFIGIYLLGFFGLIWAAKCNLPLLPETGAQGCSVKEIPI